MLSPAVVKNTVMDMTDLCNYDLGQEAGSEVGVHQWFLVLHSSCLLDIGVYGDDTSRMMKDIEPISAVHEALARRASGTLGSPIAAGVTEDGDTTIMYMLDHDSGEAAMAFATQISREASRLNNARAINEIAAFYHEAHHIAAARGRKGGREL